LPEAKFGVVAPLASVVVVFSPVLVVDEVDSVVVDVDVLVSLADCLLPPHPATAITNVASASRAVNRRMTLLFRRSPPTPLAAGPPQPTITAVRFS